MNMLRAALVGLLLAFLAQTALAQAAVPGTAGEILGGRAFAVAPQGAARNPTPLFMLGGVAVGIWTHVPPPYGVTVNRNGAANPLW